MVLRPLCPSCRRTLCPSRSFPRRSPFQLQRRSRSSATKQDDDDISSILSKPTWSVRSLLPDPSSASEAPEISPKQLHHLLRLSALSQPETEEEEQLMLETLSSQIHFVKKAQSIDTTGVEPLRAIRDETVQGQREAAINLDDLRKDLNKEESIGRAGRIWKNKEKTPTPNKEEDWDPLGYAEETHGRFFVVRTGKKENQA